MPSAVGLQFRRACQAATAFRLSFCTDALHMTAVQPVLTKTASELNLRPCRHQVQLVLTLQLTLLHGSMLFLLSSRIVASAWH